MTTSSSPEKTPWMRYVWILYNVLLLTVIAVSGAILFMVMVGMLSMSDKQKKDDWIEVNSQILNGVFTWMAITNHPFFFTRLLYAMRLVNPQATAAQKEHAATTLSTFFPQVFRPIDPQATTEMQHTATRMYTLADALYLRTSYVILNGNCLFQYPITIVMWAFPPTTRPGLVVAIFLPLSFLCNVVGQWRLYKLKKQSDTTDDHPDTPEPTPLTPEAAFAII